MTLPRARARRRASAAATSTRPSAWCSPTAATAFVKTRADAARGRVRGGGRGARAGWPSRARCARRACSTSASDYLALEWIERGAPGRRGRGGARARAGARRTRRARRASARAAARMRASRRGSARCGCRTSRPPTGRRSTPSGGCARWRRIARERGALSRVGARRASSACASGSAELCGPPEPPARLHGDLWSGNVMADAARAPVADRPVGLRRAPRGRPGDAEAVRRAVGAGVRRLRARSRRWPTAGSERVELYQLLPLLVHALLFGGSYGARPSASRGATRARPERDLAARVPIATSRLPRAGAPSERSE